MANLRRRADVIFVIDISGSMHPCLRGVCSNIESLVRGLEIDFNEPWDIRLDFVAANSRGFQSLYHHGSRDALLRALYRDQGRFFTRDLDEFRQGLERVANAGGGWDELTLVGIDTALDFPWRHIKEALRALIVMTDEPVDGGANPAFERARIEDGSLPSKAADLYTQLFIFAPECDVYDELGAITGSQHELVEHDGLAGVDFARALEAIGKTISASRLQGPERPVQRALYGQDDPDRFFRSI